MRRCNRKKAVNGRSSMERPTAMPCSPSLGGKLNMMFSSPSDLKALNDSSLREDIRMVQMVHPLPSLFVFTIPSPQPPNPIPIPSQVQAVTRLLTSAPLTPSNPPTLHPEGSHPKIFSIASGTISASISYLIKTDQYRKTACLQEAAPKVTSNGHLALCLDIRGGPSPQHM
ncbi:hypothetical protein RRG08_014405 [Elysia crispata]|uniref:Uncharacterized protein n=1 Tax=Elysia crispata TaxID=231223 RepID=A0AAE0YV24_9GAST|nr:hypothetical protein RRG08_014405 [Elysia crispata]